VTAIGRPDDAPRPRLSPRLAPALLGWFRAHRRPLPWRRDRDPYRVWVAEVLLQQTRVAQAVPYFERFVAAFPDVAALAAAPLEDVLKVWEGAGYYGRAHRLHAAAREVVARHHGRVPSDLASLERLPGVGPYIARAVASLAFGARVVALEANGVRVTARWVREERDPRRAAVRASLESALERVLPAGKAGLFNEAVMELGEEVCRPTAPDCAACPVARFCRAYRETTDPGRLPVRPGRRTRPHVRAAVVVLTDRDRWLVQQRPPTGLLGGLWEFPGGKIRPKETPRGAARRELKEETGVVACALRPRGVVRHGYSHFSVELHVFEGRPSAAPRPTESATRRWVTLDELCRLPLPRATEKVLRLLATLPAGRASPGSGSRPGRTRASAPATPRPRERPAHARRTGS
jgi:A/G-specific adenine glycosylase